MTDLISRQAAIEAIGEVHPLDYNGQAILTRLKELPTIDPVKHGKWIKDGESYALYKCSACNDLCIVAGWANCIPEEQMYKAFKFCQNCGAKMDGGEG